MTPSVVVAMPWRPTPERATGWAYVAAWWELHFPSFRLRFVDSGHQPFNLAATRNAAVREAERWGADVVVIPDADFIPGMPGQIDRAVEKAQSMAGLVLPYTHQLYLTEAETDALLAGTTPTREGGPGNGACYVVTPADYWDIGGSDERFIGWGGEDDAIVAAALSLQHTVRIPGVARSLWHADEHRPVGTLEHRPNSRLATRYWDRIGSRTAMRALLAEPGRGAP